MSRGELIEIGGSFRLPDIMARAGTRLREVGTTNRTHLSDFAAAIGPQTGLILKVHASNYAIAGLHRRGAGGKARRARRASMGYRLSRISAAARWSISSAGGCRTSRPPRRRWRRAPISSPSAATSCLGGPQAGLVVGRADLIARLARNPLKRALRLDKIRLAALEAVLRLYADPDRLAERLPALRLLARPAGEIAAAGPAAAARASRRRSTASPRSTLVETRSQIGSGALPVSLLPSAALALRPVRGSAPQSRRWRAPCARCRSRSSAASRPAASFSTCAASKTRRRSSANSPALLRRQAMILATAGHIDHGKTALVRALTGVDADRLPEEKRRGLTIDLGFAYATLPDGTELGFVDVPGHERFLPNMLAGVLSIDRVLLVVAADDGPRPQTLEHLDILELIGVAEVTGGRHQDRPGRARPHRGGRRARSAPCSPPPGYRRQPDLSGVEPHRRRHRGARPRICARAPATPRAAAPRRRRPGLFRMPIDRAFTLPGIGLVVTGTAAAGAVAVGDRLDAQPERRRGAGARAACAEPAGRERPAPASAAPSISPARFPTAASRGAATGSWRRSGTRRRAASICDCALSRFAEAPLRDGLPVHLHLGTDDMVGRARGARRPRDRAWRDRLRPDRSRAADRRAIRRPRRAARSCRPPHSGRRPGRRPVSAAARPPAPGAARHARARSPKPSRRRLWCGCSRSTALVDLAQFALARNLAPAELAALTEGGPFLRVGAGARFAHHSRSVGGLGECVIAALAAWHRHSLMRSGPTRPALLAQLRGMAARDCARAALVRARRAPAVSCARARRGDCRSIGRD